MTDPLEHRLRDALAMHRVPPAEQHVRAAAEQAVARRRRRITIMSSTCLAAVVVLLGAMTLTQVSDRGDRGVDLAAGDAQADPEPSWAQPPPPGWTRLADAPLSPRLGATVVSAGQDVVVVGGPSLLCEAKVCQVESDPTLSDGAAFNLDSRTWRPIAPSPMPFDRRKAVVVDDNVFLLSSCESDSPACVDYAALLRYRPSVDAWDVLRPPPEALNHQLARLGAGLVAYSTDEMRPSGPDWRLDLTSGAWTKLPKDPLPPVISRVMEPSGGDLLLYGRQLGGQTAASTRMVAARLDFERGTWIVLPPAPGTGFEEAVLDRAAIRGAGVRAPGSPLPLPSGGIFDPGSGAWRPLPAEGWLPAPASTPASDSRSGVVGVLRKTSATYAYGAGTVLDVEAGAWVELPPVDDRQMSSITSVGRRLFQFGGARKVNGAPAQLLADAWVWTS